MTKLRKGWEWFKAYIRANRVSVYKSVAGILVSMIPITNRIPPEAHPFASKLITSAIRNGIDWCEERENRSERFGAIVAVTFFGIALIGSAFMAGPLFFIRLGRLAWWTSVLYSFFSMPVMAAGLNTQQPVTEGM